MKLLKSLILILKHKYYVLIYACLLKIGYLGLIHDFSKFSLSELIPSTKNYLGNMSPQVKERQSNDGYSLVSIHHTGRNKHHWQYWVDYADGEVLIYLIPFKYVLEIICDSIAATKIYSGKNYQRVMVYDYFIEHQHTYLMHPAIKVLIAECLYDFKLNGNKALSNKDLRIKYDELTHKYAKVIHLKLPVENIA